MRDLEIASEPGPTSVDNRFYQVGQRGPGGKFARIGIQKAPPAYTFGSRSETALPRVLDKSLMIEIVGRISPGPGTSTPDVTRGKSQDKTPPSWTMGKLVNQLADKEALAKPAPNETHVSDEQLQLTRYRSAPCFSFASRGYKELLTQDQASQNSPASKLSRPSTASATAKDRRSAVHAARLPGPTTYDHGCVQTSLRRHRNLADGIGVSQRFARAYRFLPIDTAPKDDLGPTTYAKAMVVPGPQKYRPSVTYLSTPLAF